MKYLILFLILTITAQPLSAESCDMEMDQTTSGHMMNMDHDSHEKSDCCDSDSADIQEGCDGAMNCGFCPVTVSATIEISNYLVSWIPHHPGAVFSGLIAADHSPPPFHPPIS